MPFAAAKLPTFALRHRIRSDLPPRGGIPSPGTKREREISSIGGQQCVRVRIASGRQLSMQREWWSLHPSEGGGNKGWRSWNTSSGINGNRRSNRVFFQLMARMIGDETRVARGWGRRTRVFGRVCGRSWWRIRIATSIQIMKEH